MTRSTIAQLAGVAALVALAGCATDSATAPQHEFDQEIEQGMLDDAGQGISVVIDELGDNESSYGASSSIAASSGASADVALATTVTCGGPDDDGWYRCDAVTDRGLQVTRRLRFWEGTSFGLWWSPTKTDSVNHEWSAQGTLDSRAKPGKVWTILSGDSATMHVSHDADPVQHEWDGVGTHHESSTYTVNGVERDFSHLAHDTAAAITFDMPRSAHPYPVSGSYVRNVTSEFTAGDYSKTLALRVVVTFDGSPIAELQAGELTCDLDLETRSVSNCQ